MSFATLRRTSRAGKYCCQHSSQPEREITVAGNCQLSTDGSDVILADAQHAKGWPERSSDCAVGAQSGKASTTLFAIGPLTRGTFFEIDAVPDIRVQCARLANCSSAEHLRTASGRRHLSAIGAKPTSAVASPEVGNGSVRDTGPTGLNVCILASSSQNRSAQSSRRVISKTRQKEMLGKTLAAPARRGQTSSSCCNSTARVLGYLRSGR
jgi:hypothetical protein